MLQPMRLPIRKTIRRNNIILQSMDLPVIMNINPRSIYNKTDEFSLLLDQYQADVITMSESWERDNLPLDELLNLDNYKILSNVKQRGFKGGKPAILVNKEKYKQSTSESSYFFPSFFFIKIKQVILFIAYVIIQILRQDKWFFRSFL